MRARLLAILLIVVPAAGAAGQQARATVEGRVITHAGAGLNGATVALVSDAASIGPDRPLTSPFIARTAATGAFRIVDVPSGRYRLLVEKAGYVRQAFGARPASSEGSVITINAGDQKAGVDVTLTALAAISGVARDDSGEPVSQAMIRIYRRGYSRGERMLVNASATVADATGEYKVTVPPGDYVVAVLPRSEAPVQGLRYALTYFPGTADPELATPVSVQDGAVVAAVDINLVKVSSVRVAARVTGPQQSGLVIATPRASYSPRAATVAQVQRDGTFAMPGVIPGRYTLVVASGMELSRVYGWTDLDVTGPDEISDAVVPTFAQFEMPVRIVDPGGTAAETMSGIRVVMSPIGFRNAWSAGTPDFSGRLVLEKMQPTLYELHVQNLPAGTYPAAVRLGGRVFPLSAIDAASVPPGAELEITLASDAGSVTGRVRPRRDADDPVRAVVALIPRGTDAAEASLYRRVTTDEEGHFVIAGVPPREYDVAAWESLEPGAELSAAVVAAARRSRVTVAPRSAVTATLEMSLQP